jgi:gluconolactonase
MTVMQVAQSTAPRTREANVTAIPGIIAAGAKWEEVWRGGDNADGILTLPDGSLLFAQEQSSTVRRLDNNGMDSAYFRDTHGTGALGIDAQGRIFGAQRTCSDPGRNNNPANAPCAEATKIGIIYPVKDRKVLTDNNNGMPFGRVNDLVVDKKGGVYFNGGGTYYVNAKGVVTPIMGLNGMPLNTNGLQLSPDEKTFYGTSAPQGSGGLVAYDVQPDGTVKNGRQFVVWETGGGDGATIDSMGNIYVTATAGIQVVSPAGKILGVIPTPRGAITVAFAGPQKKTLYIVGTGMLAPDGRESRLPTDILDAQGNIVEHEYRDNGKTIYKIQMLSEGFKGRAK